MRPMQAAWVLAVVLGAAALSLRSGQAPEPVPRAAPPEVFSGERAMEVAHRLLGDGRPHPVGSAANAVVRDRLLAEFERIGIPAEVRRRFACGAWSCATVENVLAHLPGAASHDAILLTAHYDSVPAGPGAADDGAGVAAVVEAARALKAGAPLARDVWFLLSDGEEVELLGAHAFAREPEFAAIGWVLNVEARGGTGPAWLIEMQPGNAGVVAAGRRALPRPVGTSLDYEIYKRLPNDTDFSVYRMQGRGGANFAVARGAARYHTPLDDLAHLSPGSVQHLGDSAVALAREFARTPPERLRSARDAVFLHPFACFQLAWPVAWNGWLLAAGLSGWLVLAWRTVRRGDVRASALALGCAVAVAWWLAVLLPAWLLARLLGALGATPAEWTAQGGALAACFASLGAGWAACLAWRAPASRWQGAFAGLAAMTPFVLLASAAVLWMPGASFGGLLPLLALAIVGNLAPRRVASWSGAAAALAAVAWTPYVAQMYDAIGRDGLVATALLAALATLPLLPAIAAFGRRARLAAVLALLAVAGFASVAVLRPAFDASTPRTLNLVLAGEDGKPSRLLASPLSEIPAPLLAAQGFEDRPVAALPFSARRYHPGVAGPPLQAPAFEIVSDERAGGRRRLALRLLPARDGDEVTLHLPASVAKDSVRVDGVPLAASRRPWPHSVSSLRTPSSGVVVAFDVDAAAAFEAYLVGGRSGVESLPSSVADRDRMGVPQHGGDRTLAWRRLLIAPAPGA